MPRKKRGKFLKPCFVLIIIYYSWNCFLLRPHKIASKRELSTFQKETESSLLCLSGKDQWEVTSWYAPAEWFQIWSSCPRERRKFVSYLVTVSLICNSWLFVQRNSGKFCKLYMPHRRTFLARWFRPPRNTNHHINFYLMKIIAIFF